MGCTTLLVGKACSYDGSTLVARTEDNGAGSFQAKKFIRINPEDQPRKYESVISKVKIDLPDNPIGYSSCPNAERDEGYWACAGINDKNVGMTATETITSNERILALDPLVKGGIGEEDIVTLVLPYISSAREGVLRLASLLEEHGTYEKNGIGFHDEDEIWWLETIGGHHWIAKRVPDDSYVIMPNQLGIDEFDLDDAFNAKINYLCSEDLRDFIEDNFLNPSMNGGKLINPRLIFGSDRDSDHVYNSPRAWIVQRYFNRKSNKWDGCNADYRPDSADIPWSRVPEKKITINDVKYVLSHHYQGSKYDIYGNDDKHNKLFRPIGINRNNVLVLTQIRPYMPDPIKGLQWLAFGSTEYNGLIASYTKVKKTPSYLANTTNKVTTDNFYWSNRLIAALADYKHKETKFYIESYQERLMTMSFKLIKETDEKVLAASLTDGEVTNILEACNEKISEFAKEETDKLLWDVLNQTSLLMKNSFSRSDG